LAAKDDQRREAVGERVALNGHADGLLRAHEERVPEHASRGQDGLNHCAAMVPFGIR